MKANKMMGIGMMCVMFMCGTVANASPSKTANAGLWSADSDNVSSKIGLGDIDFSKVLLNGEYKKDAVVLAVAADFSVLRMGVNYNGNFWQLNRQEAVGNYGMGGSDGRPYSTYDNKNDILLTFNLPTELSMGFSVGFGLSGNYQRGDLEETFAKGSDSTKEYGKGVIDGYKYVPKIGYAIRVPFGDFVLRPQLDVAVGYAPNAKQTSYTTTGGGGGPSLLVIL